MKDPFTHAIEILEERECALRAHIRKCNENSSEIMYGVGDPKDDDRLKQVQAALRMLRETPRLERTDPTVVGAAQ